MSADSVMLSRKSAETLRQLEAHTGTSVELLLDQAIEDYRRKMFIERTNKGYAAMRADTRAWSDEEAERRTWDTATMDGLDARERWTEDGRSIIPEED